MSGVPLVLIVEDDELLRSRLAAAFRSRGLEVAEAATTEEAERWLSADVPEFVVLDLRVPSAGGLSLISRFKEADAETKIVVLTGYGSITTTVEAVKRGATQYLSKPANADEILAAFGAPVVEPSDVTLGGPMSLDRVEWEYINRVLASCGGSISEAARLLRLHRRSLQRKLSRYAPK